MKLDLGGVKGQHKGFTAVNIDKRFADVLWDLNKFPYPWKDNSVDDIVLRHVLEHLDKPKEVMLEIYRILIPNGKAIIAVPYGNTTMKNPSHQHDFLPEWFREFENSVSPYNVKTIGNKFKISISITKGKIRLWKPYEIKAIMVKKGGFDE